MEKFRQISKGIVGLILVLLIGCQSTMKDSRILENEFNLEEATIGQIHAALGAGEITCVELVEGYLERIGAYDQPTRLNAFVVLNPRALERAAELDAEFRRTGKLRALHGIPIIVKDNYDTHDLQTSAGSLALKGSLPLNDATQVRKLREAGVVVLGKSNMAEWAFNPYVTVSSIGGLTRNPYDLERVPAGSSGGTAAAVAANFGVVGLGTDTGNSIRGPSSHCCLVGIRSTIGLTSRDGIVPLYLRNDVGGPIARTVEDAVRILEVIAGYDPADRVTEDCRGKVPDNYRQFLDKDGLLGMRVGVLRRLSDTESADPEVKALFEKALEDMQQQGAVMVDPFEIENYRQLSRGLWTNPFHQDVNHYLSSLPEDTPFKTLQEIVDSGLYSPYIEDRLKSALETEVDLAAAAIAEKVSEDPRRAAFLAGVVASMDEYQVDVVVYPTWNNPPRKIGDMQSPHGNNSQQIPPATGQPAMTVPMGFTEAGLPTGLQIFARPYDEPTMIRCAYAYEQATKHRRPPELFSEK